MSSEMRNLPISIQICTYLLPNISGVVKIFSTTNYIRMRIQ